MNTAGSTALVTGGRRGLGRAFTAELLARGAVKVYATSRTPRPADDPHADPHADPRIVPVVLDVTDEAAVAALAERAGDVDLVVNNAGLDLGGDLLTSPLADLRAQFETNVVGVLAVARSFARVLAGHGGGALVQVHSALSWATSGRGYDVTKTAVWSLTNGLRGLLEPRGTQVTGVHLGFTDTDMVAHLDVAKNDPRDVVRAALDGLERGDTEVLVDEVSRGAKSLLAGDPRELVLFRARPVAG